MAKESLGSWEPSMVTEESSPGEDLIANGWKRTSLDHMQMLSFFNDSKGCPWARSQVS